MKMYSKLFPYDEQLWNRQDTFESRIIAYTPEAMMMEYPVLMPKPTPITFSAMSSKIALMTNTVIPVERPVPQ